MSSTAWIEGREACVAAWRDVLLALPDTAPRTLWCLDADFADWPLDEPPVLQALLQWGRAPGRMLQIVAHDFDAVARRHARFAAWRRDWSHCVQAWRPAAEDRVELPGLLVAGPQAVEMLDRERWRARSADTPAERRRLLELAEAVAARCESAWPPTVLGL